MLFLYGSFAVPGDALARVDRASDETILVCAAETVLREFVAELRSGDQTLKRVAWVGGNRRETGFV